MQIELKGARWRWQHRLSVYSSWRKAATTVQPPIHDAGPEPRDVRWKAQVVAFPVLLLLPCSAPQPGWALERQTRGGRSPSAPPYSAAQWTPGIHRRNRDARIRAQYRGMWLHREPRRRRFSDGRLRQHIQSNGNGLHLHWVPSPPGLPAHPAEVQQPAPMGTNAGTMPEAEAGECHVLTGQKTMMPAAEHRGRVLPNHSMRDREMSLP